MFAAPLRKQEVAAVTLVAEFLPLDTTGKKPSPQIYRMVREPLGKLTLRVKFPEKSAVQVTPFYVGNRQAGKQKGDGVLYDPNTDSAVWTIAHPKQGYAYGLEWSREQKNQALY